MMAISHIAMMAIDETYITLYHNDGVWW